MAGIDWSKPIETREGRPAIVLEIISNAPEPVYPVWVAFRNGANWVTDCVTIDGRAQPSEPQFIRNIPEKIVRYVNVYADGFGANFKTRAECDVVCNQKTRIACVRVEYTEGQYDE